MIFIDCETDLSIYTYKEMKQKLKEYNIPNRSRLTTKKDMCKAIVNYIQKSQKPLNYRSACPEIEQSNIKKIIKEIRYTTIRQGHTFYRGLRIQDKYSQACLPFYRGVYTSTYDVASLYDEDIMLVYKTVRPLKLFLLCENNIFIIYKILQKLFEDLDHFELSLRNGSVLTIKDAVRVIQKYSNLVPNKKRELMINTQQMLTFSHNQRYIGLWFAEILCYFGFDGYNVPSDKFYRNRPFPTLFHEEYYFCNPLIDLQEEGYI